MDEYENIECFKKNKRKYRRCLKNFLNGLRQKHGHDAFKTIVKFKQLFNEDNETTYDIANDLYEASKTTYPATDFVEFGDFQNLLKSFGGKTIKVVYMPTTDGSDMIYDYDYNVPSPDKFDKWWDGKKWDWMSSERTIFEENDYEGKVYITESLTLTTKHIQQSYLDNETQNCIFSPILDICEQNIINPELAASTQRKFNGILKKINKYMIVYKDGVPDEDLDEVCKKLNIKITLKRPFSNRTMVFGKNDNKAYLTLSYINTRINHVEVEGKYYNNNKPKYISEEEFADLHHSLIDNKQFFIYQKKDMRVYGLKTIENNYKVINNEYDVFNNFEKNHSMDGLSVDDVYDELLSKFIRTGCHQTSTRINDEYRDRLAELQPLYKEIDCIKAYTQFKNCSYYEGFLGKVTDFRQTDKIEGIGYYLIGNIDWTHANKQLKEIQKAFCLYSGRNIYASPELKFMTDNGLKFKIKGGCWGIRHDFEFDQYMYEKVNGISHYAKWTGMVSSHNDRTYYYMNTDDTTYAEHIMEECEDAHYYKGVVRFSMKRDTQLHKSHISGFIYGYQRINLIEQLYAMDIGKIIRINTDGIKYLDHEFERSPIFRVETKLNKDSFTNDDRYGGFLTNISDCDRCDWLRFHYHFLKKDIQPRTHYNTEIFVGQGGGGKTHRNLIDKGLIRPLYVAPSYKLTRSKQLEYDIDTHVLANLLSPNKHDEIIRKYNTIIIDEASMISEGARNLIYNMYSKCKLIFCGDVGYQAEPVEGREIDMNMFENINEVTVNYRSKCEQLNKLIQKIREGIKSGERNGMKYIKDIQRITRPELLNKYTTTDIILTHTNNTITMYNELIDKEKYLVTKSCKKFSRGEVFLEKPKTNHFEKTNAFTTHSVQGETFNENIFIDIELAYNIKLLYTAVSRAKYLNQVYIINRHQ
jgi:hypothetical protein